MKSIRFLWQELAALVKNRKLAIAVVGVMVVPLLYSSVYLWANWDPYGKLNQLPVAVVNEDEGADFHGKQLEIGRDLVKKLKEDEQFKWDFVNREQANSGLEKGEYYMAIQIPSGFSSDAATVAGEQPTPPQFHYWSDEGNNYIASQIGRNAMEKLKSSVASQLTEAYTEAMFDNIRNISDGLAQASDGAGALNDGAKKAQEGADRVRDNLRLVSSGTLPLRTGLTKLNDGAGQLTAGLNKLQQSAGELAGGLGKLGDAHKQLAAGTAKTGEGAQQLEQGAASLGSGLEQLHGGAEALQQELERFAAAHPELAQDASWQQLQAQSRALTGGFAPVQSGRQQLAEGAARLAGGAKDVNAGMAAFTEQLQRAAQGGTALQSGAAQLTAAGTQLQAGLQQAVSGADKLSVGTSALTQGAEQLSAGMQSLAGGTAELSGKLGDAAAETANVNGGDSVYKMFAQPVQLEEDKVHGVPNYGTGFTPFFLSLALFIGAIIMTVIFPLKKPAADPKSGFSWYFAKAVQVAVIGIAQALLADIVLLYGLGLNVQSVPLFVVFSIVTSVTSMAVIQFLVTTLGDPGRFLGIILLILQLAASSGSYPVELIPPFLQQFHPWLPLSYAVSGFRSVISTGAFGEMWRNVGMLAVFWAIFNAATMVYFIVSYRGQRRRSRRLTPETAAASE